MQNANEPNLSQTQKQHIFQRKRVFYYRDYYFQLVIIIHEFKLKVNSHPWQSLRCKKKASFHAKPSGLKENRFFGDLT